MTELSRFRYTLFRDMKTGTGTVLFVMLNPSIATETQDDPTIRRCKGFVADWGYRHLAVCNLYPFRATKPRDLWRADDRRGDENGGENLRRIMHEARYANMVVAAWGANAREAHVVDTTVAAIHQVGEPVHMLGLTSKGHPRHPLFVPKVAKPIVWRTAPAQQS